MTGDEFEHDYTLSRKAGWFARATSPPRPTPARYTRSQLDALGGVERRRYDDQRAVWHANLGPIVTPQMHTLFDELDEIVQSNRQDGDRVRSAAVLSALPGLGKSTVAVCYGVRYHREQVELHGSSTPEGHDRVPVVYLALTSSTTMRSLNSALCRFFEHPGWAKGNASLLADRATDCVLSCQTRLIIIDDVHFLDMNRRDGREVANHFKWLQSQFPVTFLFVGVGILERQMLTEGLGPADAALAQTARRWTALSLSPFEIATDAGTPDVAPAAVGDRARSRAQRQPSGHARRPAGRLPLRPLDRALRVADDADHPRLLARDPNRSGTTQRRPVGSGPQRRGGRARPPGNRRGLRARAAHHTRDATDADAAKAA